MYTDNIQNTGSMETGQELEAGMTLIYLTTLDLVPMSQNTGGAEGALPSFTLGKVEQAYQKTWKVGGFIP